MQLYSSEPTQSGMCDGLVPQAFQAVVILFTSHGGSLLVGPARATSLGCIFRYTITLSTVVLSTQTYLNFSEESLSSYKYFHSRGHAVGNQLGAKCNLFVSKSLFLLSGTTAESLRKLEAWVISVPLWYLFRQSIKQVFCLLPQTADSSKASDGCWHGYNRETIPLKPCVTLRPTTSWSFVETTLLILCRIIQKA